MQEATTIQDGIKIQPERLENYRKIAKLFEQDKIESHTYQLTQDKDLKIVIRGLHIKTDVNEISEDLTEKGFQPKKNHPNGKEEDKNTNAIISNQSTKVGQENLRNKKHPGSQHLNQEPESNRPASTMFPVPKIWHTQ